MSIQESYKNNKKLNSKQKIENWFNILCQQFENSLSIYDKWYSTIQEVREKISKGSIDKEYNIMFYSSSDIYAYNLDKKTYPISNDITYSQIIKYIEEYGQLKYRITKNGHPLKDCTIYIYIKYDVSNIILWWNPLAYNDIGFIIAVNVENNDDSSDNNNNNNNNELCIIF